MKIELDEKEINTLAAFSSKGGADVDALKKLFRLGEADLIDIRNIDPKGNVGLQTCARQEAQKILAQIKQIVFPESEIRMEKPKPLNQFR